MVLVVVFVTLPGNTAWVLVGVGVVVVLVVVVVSTLDATSKSASVPRRERSTSSWRSGHIRTGTAEKRAAPLPSREQGGKPCLFLEVRLIIAWNDMKLKKGLFSLTQISSINVRLSQGRFQIAIR